MPLDFSNSFVPRSWRGWCQQYSIIRTISDISRNYFILSISHFNQEICGYTNQKRCKKASSFHPSRAHLENNAEQIVNCWAGLTTAVNIGAVLREGDLRDVIDILLQLGKFCNYVIGKDGQITKSSVISNRKYLIVL